MADHRFQDDQDQDELQISFGMMMHQSSSSSCNHANPIRLKDGGTYDMGELDQALFLYLDGHDQPPVYDHKQTLNIFPSQPMHVDPSAKGDLSLLPSTSSSSKRSSGEQSMEPNNQRTDISSLSGKGKDIKTALMMEEKKKSTASSSEQEGPKTPDAKTLRRLAQNREAAKKSRLRKKAYIQQLENSRIKLIQLEQELHRTRSSQVMLFNGVDQTHSSSINGLSSDAVAFDMEYARWKEDHHHLVRGLQAAVQEHLQENELRVYVDKCLAHYDEMMSLRNAIIGCDVFHLVSGMWMSPAERCFMWIGGFRPSQLIKVILRHIEPLTEQQILGICGLQQSAQETEEALSQGLAALHQSVTDTIVSDALSFPSDMANYMTQMSVAMSKLNNFEGFVTQGDNLRQHTLHRLHQILTTRQAARCFLAMADYFHRLRALSSLWMARPRTA